MKPKKYGGPGRHFQTRIILYLLLFSCVPVLILWLVQQTITSQILKNQIVSKKQMEFTNFNRQLDELVEQQNRNLEQFVLDEDVIQFLQGQPDSVYRVNYKLQLAFGAERDRLAVYVIPKGKEPATGTLAIPDYYQFPYNELDWGIFRKVNDDTGSVIHLNERRGSNISRTVFSIAQAVQDEGVIIGYIVIDVRDMALETILSEDSSEKGNTVYLYDDWGFVCYSNGGRNYEGRNGLPEYSNVSRAEFAETKMADGTSVGMIWQKNKSTGLTFLGEVPFHRVSETMKALEHMVYRLLAVCTLLSVVAAVLTANQIVVPLHIILEHIHSVQRGEFMNRINSGRKDEFGVVMEAFDEMTEKIVHYIHMVEEKQKNLRLAEIKNLQAQIRPHFLYNTLDLIKWNIRLGEEERAVEMIANLGKLLRSTIDCNDYVTVEEELDIVQRYLEIQAVHYNGHLTIEWEVEEGIRELVIPKLILQPVVENSVIHGLSPQNKNNLIRICCQRNEGHLIFHVADNGKGIPAAKISTIHECKEQSDSIGISNVHSRLVLFGDDTCGVFFQDCANGADVMLVCRILEMD